MFNSLESTRELLVTSLQIAVPLAAKEFLESPELLESFNPQTEASFIASSGDEILFRSSRKGVTASNFARLARAIACMCIVVPEGVTVFGCHFQNKSQ